MKAMKSIKSFCEESNQPFDLIESQWLGYSKENNK